MTSNSNNLHIKKGNNNKELSIQEITSKILELNNVTIQMILEEKIEKLDEALELLSEANDILENYSSQIKEPKLKVIINHNIGCCYQKLKNISKCVIYLEKVNEEFNKYLENKHKIIINNSYFLDEILNNQIQSDILLGDFILELRFCAKFHLQMCAAYSQNNNHYEALNHAKLAALICEDNIVKTYFLFKKIKNEINKENGIKKNKKYSKIFHEKILENEPIIISLYKYIIEYANNYKNGKNINNEIFKKDKILSFIHNNKMKISTRNILGIIKNDDWLNLFNIGNIMFLYVMSYDDLDLDSDPKYELLRDAIIEKILMFTVAYFSIANELRFINNNNDNGSYYHSKAVEISCLFLPVTCPIVKHYVNTYFEYYDNNKNGIDWDKDCKKIDNYDITKDKILFCDNDNCVNITEIKYLNNSQNEQIIQLNNNKSESDIQLYQAKTERKSENSYKQSLTGRSSKINWKPNNVNIKIEKKIIRDKSANKRANSNKNNNNHEKYNFNPNLFIFNNNKKKK